MSLIHPISLEARGLLRPVDPEQLAIDAIAGRDMTTLRYLIRTQQLNAETRATLSMRAAEHGNLPAFCALKPARREEYPPYFALADQDGNTVMHHIVMHLDDRVFAERSSPSEWKTNLRELLERHHTDIDWTQTNHAGLTAYELAVELDKPHIEHFLGTFWNDPDDSPSAEEASDTSDSDTGSGSMLGHKRLRS